MGRFNYTPKIGGFVFDYHREVKYNVHLCLSQCPFPEYVVTKGKLTILTKFDWCSGKVDVFFRLFEATMGFLDQLGLNGTIHLALKAVLRIRRVYCIVERQCPRCSLHV